MFINQKDVKFEHKNDNIYIKALYLWEFIAYDKSIYNKSLNIYNFLSIFFFKQLAHLKHRYINITIALQTNAKL